MCIRDSVNHADAIAGIVEGVVEPVVLDAGQAKDRVDTLGPVSYTHLRAHETVLDLVCRLLLEKKTHQKKQLYTEALTRQQPKLSHQPMQDACTNKPRQD